MERSPSSVADHQPNEPELDSKQAARLARELARVKRDTEAGWQEETFWTWLWKRLTLTVRRGGR